MNSTCTTSGEKKIRSFAEFKRIAITNALRHCQLLGGLAPLDLDRIAEITSIKALEKGEYLFHEGDPSHGFYIVQRGAVNVHRVSAAGKEQVIHVFRAGESFAEATLATNSGYPADARAVEPSQVLLVQKAGFLGLLRVQPELALRMLASMSLHLRLLVGQIEDLTMKNVETRLIHWLLKQCRSSIGDAPVEIELKMTKRVLAAELGTVSETLSRTFGKLREQNLISVKGNTLTVHCPSQLSALWHAQMGV